MFGPGKGALKVVKGTAGKWERCDYNVHCNKDIISSIPYHMNNSVKGYRSLILSSSSMCAEQVETEIEVMDTTGASVVEADKEMLDRLLKIEPISMFSDKFLKVFISRCFQVLSNL